MCLAFFRNLFAKKAAEASVVAAFLAMNSAASPPAAAAVAGGGGGSDTLLATVTLENFNGSGASNLTREFGHIFQDGDIPSGSKLVVTTTSDVDCDYALRDISYYASGAYKHCFVQIKDSTIAASSTRDYRLKSRSGGTYSGSPRSTTLANVLSAIDLPSIEFSSITAKYRRVIQALGATTAVVFDDFIGTGYTINLIEASDVPMTSPADYSITNGSGTTYDGTTGYDGITVNLTSAGAGRYIELELSWTHSGGSAATDLGDADVAGRITTPVSTHLFKRFCSWSMATARQIRVDWEVDVWFDAGGAIETVYIVGCPALTWFDEPNKTRLDYSAVFKKASTTLATYSTMKHNQRSIWGTFRTDTNNFAGMAYCFLGSSHSVNPVYDTAYWDACECFPKTDLTLVPDELTAGNTYVPMDDLGHRGDIDAGGTYAGRGVFPSFDMHCHLLQTPASHRTRRVNALAGLHVFYHVRSGTPDDDDPIRCLTLPLDKPGAAADVNEYVADGMPVSRYFNRDGRGDFASDYSFENQPSDGIWTSGTGDASHCVNYCGYSWLIDGHEYLKQAMLDHMTNLVGQVPRDAYGSRPKTAFYEHPEMRTAWGLQNRQWESIPQLGGGGQTRSVGFSLNLLSMLGYIGPSEPEYNFAQDWIAHCGDYLGDSLAELPSDFLALGIWPIYGTERPLLPWHNTYVVLGAEMIAKTTENASLVSFADHGAKFIKNILGDNPIRASAKYSALTNKMIAYDASTNPLPVPADMAICIDQTCTRSGDTFTVSRVFGGDGQPTFRFSDGDRLIPCRLTAYGQSDDTSFVTGLSEGTTVYARDVLVGASTITFKVAATLGGAAISLSGDSDQRFLLIPEGGLDDAYLDGNSNPLTAEDYAVSAVYIAVQINKRSTATCTNAITDQAIAYVSLTDFTGDARWKAERV